MEITPKKVSRTEIMNFSRQLAAFVRAGIPIIDAIDTLRAEVEERPVPCSARRRSARRCAAARRSRTRSPQHADVFPDFYITILRSAELTGHVDSVLDQLAAYIERDESGPQEDQVGDDLPARDPRGRGRRGHRHRRRSRLPRFKEFFESLDAKLPLPTRILLSITNFLTDYWWFLLVGFIVVVLLA